MILSDKDILQALDSGKLKVDSPAGDHRANVHASSMDLRLGKFFKVYKHQKLSLLDPLNMPNLDEHCELIEIQHEKEPFIVHPGDFVLGVTLEKVALPEDLVARVEGRSSLGRLGIIVHSTAGFIDAGFEGTITLEITNINRVPVALYPGMRVCQLAFETMSSEALVPYAQKASSKYQGQILPTASRLSIDPEFQKGIF